MDTKENTPKIMILLLFVLLAFSAVQAFQINEVKDQAIDNQEIQTPNQVVPQSSVARQAIAAPVMVGGC
jgi:hypothetical protein